MLKRKGLPYYLATRGQSKTVGSDATGQAALGRLHGQRQQAWLFFGESLGHAASVVVGPAAWVRYLANCDRLGLCNRTSGA